MDRLDWIPYLPPGVKLRENELWDEEIGIRYPLGSEEKEILERVDGRRSVRELGG